jgi:DHA3 family macrolide efflux protein-like MFS transporter
MTHPFLVVLREARLRRLWLAMSCTTMGDEVQRMAIVWLAIGLVGADAALQPAAGHAAVLAVGLLGGAFADLLRPRRLMMLLEAARAGIVLVPLAAWAFDALTLKLLVGTAVALAALRALFDPAMQTMVPALAPEPVRLRGLNGLLDVTTRTARLGGPALAGAIAAVLPAIQILWLPALASAASAAILSRLAADTAPRPAAASAWARAIEGFAVLRRDRVIRMLVLANAIMLAPWSLALGIGLPLLVAARGQGMAQLALVMGAYGLGDVLGNVIASARVPRRPYLSMFAGYVWLGGGIAAVALAPAPWAMAALALLAAMGGPFFFLQFLATVQARQHGAALTAVLRLRLAVVAAAMMAGAAIGPLPFHAFGAAATVAGCGAIILLVGLWGVAYATRLAARAPAP